MSSFNVTTIASTYQKAIAGSVAKTVFLVRRHQVLLFALLLCAPISTLTAQVRTITPVAVGAVHAGTPASSTFAGTGAAASGEPIQLRNADSLVVSTRDSQSVRELVGHVHLDQGNVSVFCDHATQYMATNFIVLTGNVRIVQGTVTMLMPRGEYEGGSGIANGSGGVTILDRRMTLRAPNGVYDTHANQADFHGGVEIEDDTLRIKARDLRYLRSSQESWLWGQVRLYSKISSSAIVGDTAHNVPATSYSVMRGHPLLIHIDTISTAAADSIIAARNKAKTVGSVPTKATKNTKKKTSAGSTAASPNTSKDKGVATDAKKNVEASSTKNLTKNAAKNSAKKSSASYSTQSTQSAPSDTLTSLLRFDTLSIVAEVMESFRAGGADRYVATRNVEVVRKNVSARAERCMYDKKEESIELRGAPLLWADSLQLSADSMWLLLPQRKLRSIQAWHSAFMVMMDSLGISRANQVSADHIHIEIKNDTVNGIQAIRDAKSLYFMSSESGPDGASRTMCDSLFLVFDQGQLLNIVWRSGVSSEYYPENLVGDGARSYYLPGYKVAGKRPVKPAIALRFADQTQVSSEPKDKSEHDAAPEPENSSADPERKE